MLFTLPADSPAKLSILAYAGIFTLAVMVLYLLLLIPALIPNRAKPEEVGKALFCYLVEAIGVAIMSVSGLTAMISVFAGLSVARFSYLMLLIIFAAGGILFLRYDVRLRDIDPEAKVIPTLLYRNSVKMVGITVVLLGAFAILSLLFFKPVGIAQRWWVNPVAMIVYGTFLVWSVRKRRASAVEDFDPFAGKKRKK